MAAVAGAAALSAIETLAPIAIKALEPVLQNILTEVLPKDMVGLTPDAPATSVEAAVAANLVKVMPALSATEYAKIKAQIGEAIAIYVTEHPGDDLEEDAAWEDILARSSAGVSEEGLVVSMMPRSTFWQMVLSGIEMYKAGLGTKALVVER